MREILQYPTPLWVCLWGSFLGGIISGLIRKWSKKND